MDQAGFRAAARSTRGPGAPVQPDEHLFDDSELDQDLVAGFDDALDEVESGDLDNFDELDDDTSIERDELHDLEHDRDVRRAAESLTRRLEDGRLRADLARLDFTGARYTRFAEELAAYGIAVCRAWLLTGEMFRQCRRRGFRLGDRPDGWELHEAESLAGETVAQALRSFRDKGLRGGGWREDSGASLKTYFIGACVFAFRNVYRARIRERRRWVAQHTYDPTDVDGYDTPDEVDVAGVVLLRERVAAAFANRPQRHQQLLIMEMLGYSRPEMAEVTDSTTAAVQQTLYRIKVTGQNNTDGSGPT